MNVFITHAEEDREIAEDLAKHPGLPGLVRLDDGRSGFQPFQKTDVVVALWSQKTMFSHRRLVLERRIMGAWAEERLILVKLDHNFLPVGLRDLPVIDATFEAARSTAAWMKVQREARETFDRLRMALFEAPSAPMAAARDEGGMDCLMDDDDLDEIEILVEEEQEPRSRKSAAAPGSAPSPAPTLPDRTVFVSYSHADSEIVVGLVEIIKENGKAVWIDKAGITPGENWAGEIVRGIKSADGILIMCSPRAFESDHIKREVYLADRYKKPMFPVFLEEADPPEDFEYFFAGVQQLRLFEINENDYPRVVTEVLKNI